MVISPFDLVMWRSLLTLTGADSADYQKRKLVQNELFFFLIGERELEIASIDHSFQAICCKEKLRNEAKSGVECEVKRRILWCLLFCCGNYFFFSVGGVFALCFSERAISPFPNPSLHPGSEHNYTVELDDGINGS